MPYERIQCVYLLATEDYSQVKIGLTKDLRKRYKQIQAMCPVRLLCRFIRCYNHKEIEEHLHVKFEHLRNYGEWFFFDEELMVFFKSLPNMPNVFLKPDRALEGWSKSEIYDVLETIGGELKGTERDSKAVRALKLSIDYKHAFLREFFETGRIYA